MHGCIADDITTTTLQLIILQLVVVECGEIKQKKICYDYCYESSKKKTKF